MRYARAQTHRSTSNRLVKTQELRPPKTVRPNKSPASKAGSTNDDILGGPITPIRRRMDPRPTQAMTARPRCRTWGKIGDDRPHAIEDSRFYNTAMLSHQAFSKFSPGPQYNCQADWSEPCTIFSPPVLHSYPRDNLIKTGTITYAGGPRMPELMRTRKSYKRLSIQHQASSRTFPTREADNLQPGPLVGHVSTFGKQSSPDHAAVQSTFATGPEVSFAPPFSAPPTRLKQQWTKPAGTNSPRQLVGQRPGIDEAPKYPPLPRVKATRNSLFPYTNS